jgi:hypothetical protein
MSVPEPFVIMLGKYIAKCEPREAADGQWLARAIVQSAENAGDVDVPLTPDLPPFSDRRSAADAALNAAKDFVRDLPK